MNTLINIDTTGAYNMTNTADNITRQQRYEAKIQALGQVKVALWVHKEDRELVLAFARQLRETRFNANRKG